MKKAILIVLMVVFVTTPCFAQEVEPDGLFSIEGTLWNKCGIDYSPGIPTQAGCIDIGFHQGTVYRCYDIWDGDVSYICDSLPWEYVDLLVFSLSYFLDYKDYNPESDDLTAALTIMQPFGFGVFSVIVLYMEEPFPKLGYWGRGMMFKKEDNWTPPGVE